MEEVKFENPLSDLTERCFLPIGSEDFYALKMILHSEFSSTDPLYYCPLHHEIVTRASKKHHPNDKCGDLYTRGAILSNYLSNLITMA